MISCPRCQAQNPQQAGFCMNCGLPLQAAPQGVPAPMQNMQVSQHQAVYVPPPAVPSRKKTWVLLGSIGLAALLLGGLFSPGGLLGYMVWGKKTGVLAANANGAPDLTRAEAHGGAPITPVPGKEHPHMPDDVRAWLEHLKETEARRKDLVLNEQAKLTVDAKALSALGVTTEMIKSITDPDAKTSDAMPTSKLKQSTEDIQKDWKALSDFFWSMTPPTECELIAKQYDVALSETPGMISDVTNLLNDLNNAMDGGNIDNMSDYLRKAQAMEGKSKPIDEAGGNTDQMVQGICDKYETAKWFSIASDIGDKGLLGSFKSGL